MASHLGSRPRHARKPRDDPCHRHIAGAIELSKHSNKGWCVVTEPIIYYWSSNSGGTESVANRLDTRTVKITGGEQVIRPYILMTPSYGSPRTKGHTPKPVIEFLKLNHEHMVGVLGAGNTNFGEDYCKAAHNISRRFQVPLLWRIDLRGNVEDINTIDRGIAEHWETLTARRRRRAPS